ncbi:AMP-binding protein [Variovorax sp. J22P271]|uniref:AMP-binding protein n=1 Tax=Variovorax davisae TaxID=3053515 RepID=UPI002578D3E1|nr:AMP-binding protein [Variovorax sp. J22P271]MDM0030591.1 AMP-binding protein [Variovorax sp. J22P271]
MLNNSELQHSLQGDSANIYSHFDRAMKKNGDRIAVACGSEFLTYRQLEHEVDKIALALLVAGAVPTQRVGIAVAHSQRLVASILAVLKIGCTYVPIDTRHPRSRIFHVV